MAPITKLFISALLATSVISAPLKRRQLAGEGAAANSILSGTDNGVGYGVENAEDNTASLITSAKGSVPAAPKVPRQLAGEGAAADSILTDTDNGVGYGTENAEDNTASLISSVTGNSAGTSSGGSGGSSPPPPPKKGPKARQLDKISNGAGAIANAAGVGSEAAPVVSTGDSVDGTLTSGAANAGAQVGSTEESTLEGAGNAVPSKVPKERRQLDKISNGAGAIANAAGVGSEAAPVVSTGDSVDGTLTSGAANAGAQIGGTEESTLEKAGSSVPSKVPRKL